MLKKKRKIVSDNICELTITIKGENAETKPAKIKRLLFKILAINAITTQFIASTIICIIKIFTFIFVQKSFYLKRYIKNFII